MSSEDHQPSKDTTAGKDTPTINNSASIQRQQTQLQLQQQQQQYPSWHSAVAGGAAGFGSRMATAPLDLIRIRRQLSVGVVYPSESLWQTWRNIVRQEGGVAALYRGNLAAIYLWVGYAATQFTVYRKVKEALAPHQWNATAVAFCAGAVAGVCATAATYPFDVCRTTFVVQGTQQQQQASAGATEEGAVSATAESKTPSSTTSTRSTPRGCVERPITIQCEPVALSSSTAHPNTSRSTNNMYSQPHSHVHPAAPPSIDSFPEPKLSARHPHGGSALPFSSLYEPCHHQHPFGSAPPIPPPAATPPPTAAATAAATTAPPRTFRAFAVTLYRQKGLAGFYAGSFPAAIQIVPYMGLNFAIYDWLSAGNLSVIGSAYAGSVSGAASKIAVYPLDTVKRRLQAQAFVTAASSGDGSQQFYRGMWDCFATVYQQEGWMSFYRGMVPSVLKTTISTSLSFAFYRWTRNGLEAAHDHIHDAYGVDE